MSTGSEFGGPPAVAASGDAGQDYLSSLLDNPLDTAGAQNSTKAHSSSRNWPKTVALPSTKQDFAHTRKSATNSSTVTATFDELQALANAAQMGSSDYAKHIANFNVKVATGDDQALLPNLELLKNGFEQVKEALAIARKNYDSAEDANQQSLTKLHGDH